jgi:hypothetical protein
MTKLIAALSFAAMSLCLASAASAKSSCEETAETNYAIAIEIGYENADMVHENTMVDCEAESLNDLIAIDGEAWLPVCQFEGNCLARQADTMLAGTLSMLSN